LRTDAGRLVSAFMREQFSRDLTPNDSRLASTFIYEQSNRE